MQVVSLKTQRYPREIFRGPEKAQGPKLCPVKSCLDGDGYLAPGKIVTRALTRKHTQKNTDTHTNTAQTEQDPGSRQRGDKEHSEVEMRCLA